MAVAALQAIERSYFDLRWHLDPVAATQAGVTTHDHRFGRYSPPALAPQLSALKAMAAALEEAVADTLEDEIDRTALLNEVRVTLRRFERERPQAKNPGFWLAHLFAGLHMLLLRRDRPPAARAEAVLARLDDVGSFLDDARLALVEPVRLFAETALQVGPGGLRLVRDAAASLSAEVPELAGRLAAAASAAAAALQQFHRDLERWRDRGTEAFALGEDDFTFRLRFEHALVDTAPELWRYGHRLKEEVEADLAARARRLHGGHWQTVVERLRADHPSDTELVAAYGAEMARARDFVAERRLAPLPAAPLEVVPTPAFMQPIIPFAAYESPGPYSADRTGWFYVTVPDAHLSAEGRERALRDHCRFELAATALHEGYPGHHLHLLHAQAQASHVRKNLWTPLTVEGWALYCEDMMGEEGFYTSEEEQFFQRVHLLWRAVRVLLDVGLHTRALSFEDAVSQLIDLLFDRAHAEAEVRRYCAEPAYNLCYAVGRRELLRLRDAYRAASSGFSLRSFHEAVLAYGGLPVTLIRWGLGLA